MPRGTTPLLRKPQSGSGGNPTEPYVGLQVWAKEGRYCDWQQRVHKATGRSRVEIAPSISALINLQRRAWLGSLGFPIYLGKQKGLPFQVGVVTTM